MACLGSQCETPPAKWFICKSKADLPNNNGNEHDNKKRMSNIICVEQTFHAPLQFPSHGHYILPCLRIAKNKTNFNKKLRTFCNFWYNLKRIFLKMQRITEIKGIFSRYDFLLNQRCARGGGVVRVLRHRIFNLIKLFPLSFWIAFENSKLQWRNDFVVRFFWSIPILAILAAEELCGKKWNLHWKMECWSAQNESHTVVFFHKCQAHIKLNQGIKYFCNTGV